MDASEIRRTRLKSWIDTEFDGRVAALCRYYDLPSASASFLSQLLSGHRVFGERAARKLESQCNRPAGWLDLDERTENPDVLRFDRKRCAKLRVEDRELIEEFIAMILERNDRRSVKSFSEVRLKSAGTEVKKAAAKPVKRTFDESPNVVRRKRNLAG